MPSRWPWRRWTPRASFFATPTDEGNDFGESFFGRGRPVTAARIRSPRRNLDGDVCRSQNPLTFSGRKKPPADKSKLTLPRCLSRRYTALSGAIEPTAKLIFFWRGRKAHEMRSDTKPSAVPPRVNVRVTPIGRFAGEPRIPVTGMDDRDVAQNPHHHIHRLSVRTRIWFGDALEKRFAVQQDAVRGGNMEVLRKILSVPAYIRLQCGPYVVSI